MWWKFWKKPDYTIEKISYVDETELYVATYLNQGVRWCLDDFGKESLSLNDLLDAVKRRDYKEIAKYGNLYIQFVEYRINLHKKRSGLFQPKAVTVFKGD